MASRASSPAYATRSSRRGSVIQNIVTQIPRSRRSTAASQKSNPTLEAVQRGEGSRTSALLDSLKIAVSSTTNANHDATSLLDMNGSSRDSAIYQNMPSDAQSQGHTEMEDLQTSGESVACRPLDEQHLEPSLEEQDHEVVIVSSENGPNLTDETNEPFQLVDVMRAIRAGTIRYPLSDLRRFRTIESEQQDILATDVSWYPTVTGGSRRAGAVPASLDARLRTVADPRRPVARASIPKPATKPLKSKTPKSQPTEHHSDNLDPSAAKLVASVDAHQTVQKGPGELDMTIYPDPSEWPESPPQPPRLPVDSSPPQNHVLDAVDSHGAVLLNIATTKGVNNDASVRVLTASHEQRNTPKKNVNGASSIDQQIMPAASAVYVKNTPFPGKHKSSHNPKQTASPACVPATYPQPFSADASEPTSMPNSLESLVEDARTNHIPQQPRSTVFTIPATADQPVTTLGDQPTTTRSRYSALEQQLATAHKAPRPISTPLPEPRRINAAVVRTDDEVVQHRTTSQDVPSAGRSARHVAGIAPAPLGASTERVSNQDTIMNSSHRQYNGSSMINEYDLRPRNPMFAYTSPTILPESSISQLHEAFRRVFTNLRATNEQFESSVRLLYTLRDQGYRLHRHLWVDFIVRRHVDYVAHLQECIETGSNSMPYEDFYDKCIQPKYFDDDLRQHLEYCMSNGHLTSYGFKRQRSYEPFTPRRTSPRSISPPAKRQKLIDPTTNSRITSPIIEETQAIPTMKAQTTNLSVHSRSSRTSQIHDRAAGARSPELEYPQELNHDRAADTAVPKVRNSSSTANRKNSLTRHVETPVNGPDQLYDKFTLSQAAEPDVIVLSAEDSPRAHKGETVSKPIDSLDKGRAIAPVSKVSSATNRNSVRPISPTKSRKSLPASFLPPKVDQTSTQVSLGAAKTIPSSLNARLPRQALPRPLLAVSDHTAPSKTTNGCSVTTSKRPTIVTRGGTLASPGRQALENGIPDARDKGKNRSVSVHSGTDRTADYRISQRAFAKLHADLQSTRIEQRRMTGQEKTSIDFTQWPCAAESPQL